MDSESYLTQDILIEKEQKYLSRVKHAATAGLIRALKMGSSPIRDIPQFFVQVNSFDIRY